MRDNQIQNVIQISNGFGLKERFQDVVQCIFMAYGRRKIFAVLVCEMLCFLLDVIRAEKYIPYTKCSMSFYLSFTFFFCFVMKWCVRLSKRRVYLCILCTGCCSAFINVQSKCVWVELSCAYFFVCFLVTFVFAWFDGTELVLM